MKKIIITSVVIIGTLVLIAFVLNNNKKENQAKIDVVAEKNASVAVKVDTIATEQIDLDFMANGSFEPIQELNMSAEKSGKIIKVLAKEGDVVRVGQTLAIMRSDGINVMAQASEASYLNAKTDYSRFENAFKTGGVTKQQLDQAKVALSNAEANYKQARINVGDTYIKAPISGVINKRHIEPGSIVSAAPATNLFDIVNVSKLKLTVNVNESQVASLKTGTKTTISASVYQDKSFEGKITFIAAKADASLNFPVEIEVANNPNNEIKAGMYGTALFKSAQQVQTLKVAPRNAFVGSVSSNQVFTIVNGKAKLTTVTSGRVFGDNVEILNGLENGDIVITTGQINIQDGDKVEVIK